MMDTKEEFRPYKGQQMNQHKDIIVPTKYLWFTNGILRRIACFRPKNTKPSARLARTHSFILLFFEFPARRYRH